MTAPNNNRRGVLAGGNWIVDHVKLIDNWPPQDALANILSESWGNGGAPYNLLKNLAKLGASFPLAGAGLVGDDADGIRIIEDCRVHNIDTAMLRPVTATTSYSDVMTDRSTGRRTFFHQRGANALLDTHHFDFKQTNARYFHLGYLLLLDKLDELENGLPRAARVFKSAREAGMTTSLDCVSENSLRFGHVVKPVLPEIDLLFVNDFEAQKLASIELTGDPASLGFRKDVEEAARRLLESGVRQWVIIHFPEAVFARSAQGPSHWQPSIDLPREYIKGTAGAGDAFASGVLYSLHEGGTMQQALELGVCTAASSLMDTTCSGGVLLAQDCLQLRLKHPFKRFSA